MANENTISEALDKAIQELDTAVQCVNMFERMIQQMDSFQLEGEALEGLRQILYRVVCANDDVCRLVYPEWRRYRDEAETKDAPRSTGAVTDYDAVPGRDC